ncbi:hypothetical protein E2493_20935 [Sphingomonas parva]|uniref:Uncharacterized protein n=1 Tax=Sphingomonas parva TaxID=2555898 RepID=A0A4Y8ZPC4_9SPHN|nr:hypothetical protein [Sphingomonas parva]TFI56296.1 hypothetical protein E2493_20935 [Sphingomonas parva]
MSVPAQTLVASSVEYYSQNDEAAFFGWLDRIECVDRSDGSGLNLFIHLAATPSDDDLRELCALFFRYGVDMTQLAVFGEGEARAWFRDPEMYWHERVFGSLSADG